MSRSDPKGQLQLESGAALIQSWGIWHAGRLLTSEQCDEIGDDLVEALRSGPAMLVDGVELAVALLEHSRAALSLLDDPKLGSWIESVLGRSALLSCAEGVVSRDHPKAWTRDFERPLGDLSSTAFRPGLTVCVSLAMTGGTVACVPSSHRFIRARSPTKFGAHDVPLPRGGALLLQAGTLYRLGGGGSWLRFRFVWGWIKPDLLFFSALSAAHRELLGEQGRRWCGESGIPTSVEEFLAAEEAALIGDSGRAKGSGI